MHGRDYDPNIMDVLHEDDPSLVKTEGVILV